jgi:hypothetical protein
MLKSKSRMMMMKPQPARLLFKLKKQSKLKQILMLPQLLRSQLQLKRPLLKLHLLKQLPKQKRLNHQLPPPKYQQPKRRPKPLSIMVNYKLPLKMLTPVVSKEQNLSLLPFKLKWMPILHKLKRQEKIRLRISKCKVTDQKINSKV